MRLSGFGSCGLKGLFSLCLSAAVCTLALSTGTQAQTTTAMPDTGQSVPTLSIAAREVLLDVVVTDKDGQPVTGLTAADFSVSEADPFGGASAAGRRGISPDEGCAGDAAQHLHQLHAG